MAINVVFYQFEKRPNSCKRPSGGTNFVCEINAECSIISPQIEIGFAGTGGTGNPTLYNYCYIDDFTRYYFIKDWSWSLGKWIATLSEDVLATWRDNIGGSTQYILRSSAQSDGSIIDTRYPAKAEVQTVQQSFQGGFAETIGSGFFVVGFISKNANSMGATTYMILTPENVKQLSHKLLDNVDYLNINTTEISDSLSKMLFNPFDYLVSCNYFPFASSGITAHLPLISAMEVGWWSIDVSGWIIGQDQNTVTTTTTVAIPKHPQAASRGEYCNSEAYSKYTLYYQPYGVIPLDAGKLWGASTLTLETTVDLFTGDAVLRVKTNTGAIVAERSDSLAVGIPLANIQVQLPSGKSDLLQTGAAAIFSGIQSIASGNSITGTISGIVDAAQATSADVASKGAVGSTIAFDMAPYITARFSILVDDNNENAGRPLCQRKQVSSIPGFIMVWDPDVSMAATQAEMDAIRRYMSEGFFYE